MNLSDMATTSKLETKDLLKAQQWQVEKESNLATAPKQVGHSNHYSITHTCSFHCTDNAFINATLLWHRALRLHQSVHPYGHVGQGVNLGWN